jgi:hypothetical protein
MPLKKHFSGHGEEVMRSMRETYKDKATAERVFYATENKRKSESETKRGMKSVMRNRKGRK